MRAIASVFHPRPSVQVRGGIFAALALLLSTSIASAVTRPVYADGRGPYPSIQSAIDASAQNGDDIELMDLELPGQSFTGFGNRNIDYGGRAITIWSQSGDPTSCIIDCEYMAGGFYFHTNETVTSVLRDVTVRKGSAHYGGGVYCVGSSPSFINCIIDSCKSLGIEGDGEGGGVYCVNSSPSFTDCIIRNNWSNYAGGGVSCSDNASPEFTNCHIDSNSADYPGGGIFSWNSSPSFSSGCYISGNSAGTDGGGAYFDGGEPSFALGCYINGNTAGGNGGGVYFVDTNPLTPSLGSSFIEDNSAGDNGGGLYCITSSPSLDSCSVSLNTAEMGDGGGVYCADNSSPAFTQCSIDSNSSHLRAGGVYCENNSDPEFTSCQIEANTALSSAGGVYCDGSSPVFNECDITHNTATSPTSNSGGVHCTNSSSPAFTHCRIDSNSAGDFGGGILCQSYSSPTFGKCTIRGNSVSQSGGGVYSTNYASPTFTNCIISGNVAGDHGGGVLCNLAAGSFEFCTLSDNVASGPGAEGGGVYCTLSSTTVFNSVIIAFSEGSGIYFKGSSGSLVEYCDLFGNTGGDIAFYNDDPAEGPPGIDAIFLDPLFVNRAAGDFHLSNESPCIGEADPVDYPDDDYYEDNPRPDPAVSVPDIGADENGNGAPAIVPALNRNGMIILLVVLLLTASFVITRKRTQERY